MKIYGELFMDTLYVNRNSFDVDFGPILQYRHYCPRWRRLSNAAFNERAILTKCNRTEVKLRRMRTARKRASDETRRRLGGELDRSTTADHVEQTTQHTQRSNDFKRVTHAVQATNIYDVTMTSCATGNFFLHKLAHGILLTTRAVTGLTGVNSQPVPEREKT